MTSSRPLAGLARFTAVLFTLVMAAFEGGCGEAAEARAPAVVDLGAAPAPSLREVPAEVDREPEAAAGRIAWTTDERAARARAAREDVPLLVVITAAWSLASRELEARELQDPRVVRAARGAVAVRVDASDPEAAREAMERLGARTVPTVLVLGPDGGERFASRGGALDVDALERALLE